MCFCRPTVDQRHGKPQTLVQLQSEAPYTSGWRNQANAAGSNPAVARLAGSIPAPDTKHVEVVEPGRHAVLRGQCAQARASSSLAFDTNLPKWRNQAAASLPGSDAREGVWVRVPPSVPAKHTHVHVRLHRRGEIGVHTRLKISCSSERAGSTPAAGTSKQLTRGQGHGFIFYEKHGII